jgi:hypothetical protein
MYSFTDEYGVRYGAAPLSCKAVSKGVSIALASFLLAGEPHFSGAYLK